MGSMFYSNMRGFTLKISHFYSVHARVLTRYLVSFQMLKPRCLRCIQMSQTSARKRGRGRGWKSRSEELNRGRGRGRGRGRARSRSEDGHDPGSDNDNEVRKNKIFISC